MRTKIAILGSGAMSTACSVLLVEHVCQTIAVWTRTPECAAELAGDLEDRNLLAGVRIPKSVELTSMIQSAVEGADLLVVTIPARFLWETLATISQYVPDGVPVVSVAKGLQIQTLMRRSEIVTDVLGPRDVVAPGRPQPRRGNRPPNAGQRRCRLPVAGSVVDRLFDVAAPG
jgi:glycerol-3-phosphate dehydrogenase (NAD(P)+)